MHLLKVVVTERSQDEFSWTASFPIYESHVGFSFFSKQTFLRRPFFFSERKKKSRRVLVRLHTPFLRRLDFRCFCFVVFLSFSYLFIIFFFGDWIFILIARLAKNMRTIIENKKQVFANVHEWTQMFVKFVQVFAWRVVAWTHHSRWCIPGYPSCSLVTTTCLYNERICAKK